MAEITQVAAIIGAIGGVTAAATGIFNALYQYLSNRESIYVGIGPVRADGLESNCLYVLNKSKFDVELIDYGFVLRDGYVFSIPLYSETEGISIDDGFFKRGEPKITPRSLFRVGMDYSKPVVGAYAITATQTFPTVRIYTHYSMLERLVWWAKAVFLSRHI